MIFRKLLTYAAAAVVMATAAGVCVVAAAFALYAQLQQHLSAPAAAAVVAVAAAILVFLVGLTISSRLHQTANRRLPADDTPLTQRLFDLARERPVVAGAAALLATVFVAKNPKIMTGLLSAVLAARAAKTPPAGKR